MKRVIKRAPVLVAALLCGCFQVQDELTVQPDGSGTVKMTVHNSLPEEAVSMAGISSHFDGGNGPIYPPTDQSEARHFFPPKDFTLKVEEKSDDKGKTLALEASFKDINVLLASPYGRTHQLALRTNGVGVLSLQALSGGSALAQAAQFKPEGEMGFMEMPGLEDAQKKKNEMSFSFRITLPNTITTANGARENKSVTWAAERAKCKDDEEFSSKLGGVLEASCSAEGLKFSPITPPRLGLLPFSQLAPGRSMAATALPDTNKIASAAKFVPVALHVTRTLDLAGESSGQSSQAELTGVILLPAELAPQRWGEAKLEEVIDAKGSSLMPKEEERSLSHMTHSGSFESSDEGENEEEDSNAPKKDASEKTHMISLNFRAPEWKVKQILRIKGTLDLEYLGGSEIVKLTNAVPPSLVMDMAKVGSSGYSFDSERGQLSDGRLGELGLAVRVQMAIVQSGMTMLTLETSGEKSALVDAQVFDAEGRPWPTTLMQPESSRGEERSCQLMVAGRPKPPFSLALAIGGVGASVGVPILVENVPAGEK